MKSVEKIKLVSCDIFRTEFTKKGIVPYFEDMVQFTTKKLYKGQPIPYNKYANFINCELQKLRKEDVTIKNETPIITEHKGSYISIQITDKEKIYKVCKMKKSVWVNWFENEYERMMSIIS